MKTSTKETTKMSRPATRSFLILAGLIVAAIAIFIAATRFFGGTSDSTPQSLLSDEANMGVVELTVSDLESMQSFYSDAVGMQVIEESEDSVLLGFDNPLIRLVVADGDRDNPAKAGLFHSAVLYENESDLANTVVRVAELAPGSFQGASDHRVSLAFYFADPEGNGLELYVDRPADEWEWVEGQVVMGSFPVDVEQFLTESLTGESVESAAMGHVHLRVGDLDLAKDFYVETLGFAVTSESDGALFMSVGGYHHHLAANTWNSAGAGVRPESLGLRSFEITVPDSAEVDRIAGRVEQQNLPVDIVDGGLELDDPWGNRVNISIR